MKIHGQSKDDLMALDISGLRAVLHERSHHGIEVMFYRILQGKMKKPKDLGAQAKFVLSIWRERGFSMDTPDVEWCVKFIALADKLNAGEEVVLNPVDGAFHGERDGRRQEASLREKVHTAVH
jgi:hypothetical protein